MNLQRDFCYSAAVLGMEPRSRPLPSEKHLSDAYWVSVILESPYCPRLAGLRQEEGPEGFLWLMILRTNGLVSLLPGQFCIYFEC